MGCQLFASFSVLGSFMFCCSLISSSFVFCLLVSSLKSLSASWLFSRSILFCSVPWFSFLFFFYSYLSFNFWAFFSLACFRSGITFLRAPDQSFFYSKYSATISKIWLTVRTVLVVSLRWSPMGSLPWGMPYFSALSNVKRLYLFRSTIPPIMYAVSPLASN